MDEIALMNGWTHRAKRKSRDPYLKLNDALLDHNRERDGALFTDMDQKFRFIYWKEVTEL